MLYYIREKIIFFNSLIHFFTYELKTNFESIRFYQFINIYIQLLNIVVEIVLLLLKKKKDFFGPVCTKFGSIETKRTVKRLKFVGSTVLILNYV